MARNQQNSDPEIRMRFVLRRGDQLAVASLLILVLTLATIYGLLLRQRGTELIDIDEAPRQIFHFQVDINQASWPELAQLPGIGETLGQRIIESREMNGPFVDHSDLQRVRGIGPRTVENLKPYLLPMPEAEAVAGEIDHLPNS